MLDLLLLNRGSLFLFLVGAGDAALFHCFDVCVASYVEALYVASDLVGYQRCHYPGNIFNIYAVNLNEEGLVYPVTAGM